MDIVKPIFSLNDVKVRLGRGKHAFDLHVPELSINSGDRIVVTGPSGCGKSTFIEILAFIRSADYSVRFIFSSGSKSYNVPTSDAPSVSHFMDNLRRNHVGFIPQVGGLVSALNVWDNIEMPLRLKNKVDDDQIKHLAEKLGIYEQLKKLPSELSVGQRQRVAIVRALVSGGDLLVADEPTAALDPLNAQTALEAMTEEADRKNMTVIVVSHDPELLLERGYQQLTPDVSRNAQDGTITATISGLS